MDHFVVGTQVGGDPLSAVLQHAVPSAASVAAGLAQSVCGRMVLVRAEQSFGVNPADLATICPLCLAALDEVDEPDVGASVESDRAHPASTDVKTALYWRGYR